MAKRPWQTPEVIPKRLCEAPAQKSKKPKFDAFNDSTQSEAWRRQAIERVRTISAEDWLQEEVHRMIGHRYMQCGPFDADTIRFLLDLPLQSQHDVVEKAFEVSAKDHGASFEETLLAHVTSSGALALVEHEEVKTPDEEEEDWPQQRFSKPPQATPSSTNIAQPRPRIAPSKAPSLALKSSKPPFVKGKNEISISVLVPKALIAKVIGTNAATIRSLRKNSGAEIDARDQDSDPVQVRVTGAPHCVEKAERLILKLVEHSSNRHADSEVVEVPKDKIGLVMGVQGRELNRIQEESGTKIDVDFSGNPCKVFIKGDEANVLEAKYSIMVIAGMIEDDSARVLQFPKWCAGAIMGKGGWRLRAIQEETGCFLDVTKDQWNVNVKIRGDRSDMMDLASDMVNQNAYLPKEE